MKRFYFLKHNGHVFALEPRSRTLITIPSNPEPAGAGAPRRPPALARTSLDALGIPAGRRHCQRAAVWEYTPLRVLIEHKLKDTVYPYTTPLTKPLVAFLAREEWTEEQNKEWEKQDRAKNTRKKQHQRANSKATKKKAQAEGWTNPSLDEESE